MQNLRPGQSLMVGRHAKLKKNCEKLDFCALLQRILKSTGIKVRQLDQFSSVNFIMWSSIAVTKSWKIRNNYGMLKKN